MPTPKPKRLLSDTYAFPGFRPESTKADRALALNPTIVGAAGLAATLSGAGVPAAAPDWSKVPAKSIKADIEAVKTK